MRWGIDMYQVENPMGRAIDGMGQAAGTYSRLTKDIKVEEPEPTAGGAIMSGAGGALMGAQGASLLGYGATSAAKGASVGGLWGAGIGAALGVGAYLLS